MRIGIILEEFQNLSNWQLRIIEDIRNRSDLEIGILIKDLIIPKEKRRNKPGEFLIEFQRRIEKSFFFKPIETIDRSELVEYLNSQNVLTVRKACKKGTPIFESQDIEVLKMTKLDIILNLGISKVAGVILDLVPYGILTISYNNRSLARKEALSFWELLKKSSTLEITIRQKKTNTMEGAVLGRAYFNPHWSLVRSDNIIVEGSVSLLSKILRNLSRGIHFKNEIITQSISEPERIGFMDVVKYCFGFYIILFKKVLKEFNSLFFGWKYQCWTLFLGKGEFLNTDLSNPRPIELPKNEFWADPFLFKYQGKTYVFFEAYCYKAKKGKISCGLIENEEIINVQDVLDLDYHLSYPFVFEESGEIYLMPETLENKRLEVYKCVRFPDKWELYTTAFEDEMVADAFFYNDSLKQKWLFVNKRPIKSLPINSELYIYRVDSTKLEALEPHAQNPVIIDSRIARNGGAIFGYKNEIYRPSQRNVDGVYGKALNINKILKLTIDEYIEENNVIFEADYRKGFISMHHIHQSSDYFVYDAAFKLKR